MQRTTRHVRLDNALLDQLLEVKRLTSIPVNALVGKAVTLWLDTAAPPIAEGMGATPQEIERLSQMRLGKPPTKHATSPEKKNRLA